MSFAGLAAGLGMSQGALAFGTIGLGLQLASGIQSSRAAQARAQYQKAVAENNAILVQRQAEDARLRGEQAALSVEVSEKAVDARAALAQRQLIARQRVTQAALGQTTDVGSALDLTSDTAAAGKLDERTRRRNAAFERAVIRNNAEREAIGFLTQGFNFAAEAQLADLRRRSARSASIIGAFGTIITTAGKVHDRWRNRRVPTLAGFDPVFSGDFGDFAGRF